MEQIFSLYGRSLARVKKHPRDWSRALVTYREKRDALYAYDHLCRGSQADNNNSSTEVTIIDGNPI